MGTRTQTNAFLPEYHSLIDVDGRTTNGLRSLYHEHEKQMLGNGQNLNPVAFRILKDTYSGSDMEKVKRMILKHETIFRSQVQELHCLYRRQRELMNTMRRKEVRGDGLLEQKSQSRSLFPPYAREETKRTWNAPKSSPLPTMPFSTSGNVLENKTIPFFSLRDDEPVLSEHTTSWRRNYDHRLPASLYSSNVPNGVISLGNSHSDTHLGLKDFFRESLEGMNGGISLSNLGSENNRKDMSSDCADLCSGNSPTFPPPTPPQRRCELVNSSIDMDTASRRKRIFGVEISEGRLDQLDGSLYSSNTILENNLVNSDSLCRKEYTSGVVSLDLYSGKKVSGLLSDFRTKPEDSIGGLPLFLRNSGNRTEPSKGKNNSYFMNLDSLKNCSQNFFNKSETPDVSFQKQKKEISAPLASDCRANDANDSTIDTKIFGFRISNPPQNWKNLESVDNLPSSANFSSFNDGGKNKNLDLQKRLHDYLSDLRHGIDLNLALNEEDAPPAPSLPAAVVKIASSEIDLEAPAVIEPEAYESPKEMEISPVKSQVSFQECDRIAAEAMIAISSSVENNLADEDVFGDRLEWFADIIISSQCDDMASVHVDGSIGSRETIVEEEESVPDGMDYFEFMTLKLQDSKELYIYDVIADNDPIEEDVIDTTLSKSSRRGRGRRWKDFQKDILPGLATLSRNEVTEDLQAFQELRKAEGCSWNSSERRHSRGGRGRKRSRGRTTPPTVTSANAASITKRSCLEQPVRQKLGFEEMMLSGWGKRTRRLPRQRCASSIMLSFAIKC